MSLLDFGSESSEILWMGEAISQGTVKEGDLCKVLTITKTADSRGFLIETEFKGSIIFDYAWRKGKTGSTLATLFDDPQAGDKNAIYCKAQNKVKNAVLVAKEEKSATWDVQEEDGKTILTFRGKTLSVTTAPGKPNETSEVPRSA